MSVSIIRAIISNPISFKLAPKLKTLFIAFTACVGGKKSFHETGKSPILNNSFFGNGYMEPENHIKIKRGIFPIVNTSFPFLQKLATIKLVP